jgi:2-polyprenyl-3-methyl-5-hydroxy-6-metoxy-1,4-benzoquinol methylase
VRDSRTYWEQVYRGWRPEDEAASPSIFDYKRLIVGRFVQRIPPAAAVLDFGCGYGRNALPLARMGFKVSVTDISTNALEICWRRARDAGLEVRPLVNTGSRVGSPAGSFAGVLAWGVIDHMTLADAEQVVADLRRVSIKGGALLASFDPEEEAPPDAERLPDGTVVYTKGDREGMRFRHYTNDEIARLMSGSWHVLELADLESGARAVLCTAR